jgi:hypothetical protein
MFFLVMTELGVAGSMRPWRTFFNRGASLLMHIGSESQELTLGSLYLTANVLDRELVDRMVGRHVIEHIHDGISDKQHKDSQGDQHETTQVSDTTFRE